MKLVHTLLLCFLFATAAAAQSPDPTPAGTERVDDVYLARDNGAGKAGEVTELFNTTDVPIHCIVVLRDAVPAAVKMNLVAVKVTGVKPGSSVVSAAYTTRQGQNRVFFTGRPEGNWVAGTYRIDIFVEGVKEKSLTFEMAGGSERLAPQKLKSKSRLAKN